MPKPRGPNWPRGTPRSQPQSTRADASDTTDLHISAARTVDPTWDPSAAASSATSFEPLRDRGEPRHSRISAGWASAILVALGIVGTATLYVAGIKSDVTLVTERVKDLREDFKRLDDRMHEFLQGKRSPDTTPAPPRKK